MRVFSAVPVVSLLEVDDDDTHDLVRMGKKDQNKTKNKTAVCFIAPY